MNQVVTLFVTSFTTLLAIINPLESLPVFLKLLEGKDEQTHRRVARQACGYATLLLFFFLVFGTLLLRLFEVPLSMVRIVGAILLTMITTYLFLAYANPILGRIGPRGIDAATRIVGFFVAAMGMGLIFHGMTEAIHDYVRTGKP
jgi:multiple antibiotic resistance protein